MPNLLTHAQTLGGDTLEQRPFDALDSLILTQLVYLPMEGITAPQPTLAECWAFLRETVDAKALDVFQQKRYQLFEACAGQPRYRGWRMLDYVNVIDTEREMQFCAATYRLADGSSYVAFRGTDQTIVGWKEDLNMSFMTVPSQQEAAAYLDGAARRHGGGALLLGGHSKGGNLAVYAGVASSPSTRDRIRRIYSFDGPGLDSGTLNSEDYAQISDRIESYIPQSSVVGMLLHYHPVYTVVKSSSVGILQHDAMTWQVEDGAFVTLEGVDMSGKITDEAMHSWLETMDMDERRLLVDTLYQVIDASQGELVTDLTDDWLESATRMLEAIRELKPEVKRDVRRMVRGLFSTGANEVVRAILPGLAMLGKNADEAKDEAGEKGEA